MAFQDADLVALRLPSDMADREALAGMKSAAVVPDLRGPAMDALNVLADTVGMTSGVVTIVLAKDELKELFSRLRSRLRQRSDEAPTDRAESEQDVVAQTQNDNAFAGLEDRLSAEFRAFLAQMQADTAPTTRAREGQQDTTA